LPITPQYVESIIEKERPDGIMLSYGGQTALNCGVKIDESGILKKYGISVLGTQVPGIMATEDRQKFKDAMVKCNVPVLKSKTVNTFDEAKKVAKDLGYPVIVRVAYTLGGKGGGVAHNEIELHEIAGRGLAASLVGQILIEEYVGNWKQIEYEVMQDYSKNNVIVCNMENVLSMKVHTGDNIVVAPSQTIDNHEYHMLRSAALRATKHVGIVGECNIQFALDQSSDTYAAIEINPRLSRSSALASKATGYPLAYMSAKIGLGYSLPELVNTITKKTTACFEPALDYIVCKHPRWDFTKFELANRNLGPTMKSVGEVMAIGRKFEEVLQKSIRMLDIGKDGLVLNRQNNKSFNEEEIEEHLQTPDDDILYYVVAALHKGISIEKIYHLSAIDPWFLKKINNIVEVERKLKSSALDQKLLTDAKQFGFSDKQIGRAVKKEELEVRKIRKDLGIVPVIKQIDTLAAEWPAETNYLYLTYGGTENDISITSKDTGIIVLGAGPYRIGSSVEFDWGTVNMVWGLQDNGEKNVVVVNCNPETVSTDYDICKRLYFEELTLERILDITEFESSKGVVTSVGGQVANNLTTKLSNNGVKIFGTKAEDVDMAENRSKFSQVLDKLHIMQPAWRAFTSITDAKNFALEVDVDGVCDGKNVIIGAIVEHIDSAGVHSGDAMMCIPPWRLSNKIIENIIDSTTRIAIEFNIKGPFNLQFLIKDDQAYVIELNIRASRSMPFVSKFTRMNLISLASQATLGKTLPKMTQNLWMNTGLYGIKVPQFSFMQLEGADIVLGVEMQSTGEAACFGDSFYDALSKGLESVGYNLPKTGSALVTIGGVENREKLLQTSALLKKLDYKILATETTAEFFKEKIGDVQIVHKISEPERKPNITDLLYEKKINFIINIPSTATIEKYVGMLYDEYQIRRKSLELGIPVLTTIELAESFVKTLAWLRDNETTKKPLAQYKDFI